MSTDFAGQLHEVVEFDVLDLYTAGGDYTGCLAMIVSRDRRQPRGYLVALPYPLETAAEVIYEPGTTIIMVEPDKPVQADDKAVMAGSLRRRNGRVVGGDEEDGETPKPRLLN